jgi:pimeloyl-ACP methyl ester carboxylesterase
VPRRSALPSHTPEPPVELPAGRIVHVPGRGEFFVRDSGGTGAPVLLLHGWCFPSDLNWFRAYGPLADAGYRVLALDHRGHGRGLRTPESFRLADCAADAAAIVGTLGCEPVLATGYSMGGPIAQLMARDHAPLVRGLVLCATSREWRDPRMRALWRSMALARVAMNVFPITGWRRMLRAIGLPDSPTTAWVASELSRGSTAHLAEAGRELGRFDSRPWIAGLDVPAAVVVTTRDTGVPPRKQRELAAALRAPTFESEGDHAVVTLDAERFNPALLAALASVSERAAQRPHRGAAEPATAGR